MKLLKTNFPIIIGMIISFIIIYKGDLGMTGNVIAIVIALIGVIGSILANFFQYKKDSNTIKDVKKDTTVILPKVDNIDSNTKEIRKYIVDDIKNNLQSLKNLSQNIYKNNDDIKLIADDVKYRKRLNNEYKGTFTRDNLITGIDEIYKDNANLRYRLTEMQKQNFKLTREKHLLEIENKNLKDKLQKYNKDIDIER